MSVKFFYLLFKFIYDIYENIFQNLKLIIKIFLTFFRISKCQTTSSGLVQNWDDKYFF